MNLSAHFHLNQPYDFKESLGRTGYESTGAHYCLGDQGLIVFAVARHRP